MSDKPSQQFKAIPKEMPKPDAPTPEAPKEAAAKEAAAKKAAAKPAKPALPPEFGGPSGPEPTRYGDWERNGKVSDF